jgi:hypothetical protein
MLGKRGTDVRYEEAETAKIASVLHKRHQAELKRMIIEG